MVLEVCWDVVLVVYGIPATCLRVLAVFWKGVYSVLGWFN